MFQANIYLPIGNNESPVLLKGIPINNTLCFSHRQSISIGGSLPELEPEVKVFPHSSVFTLRPSNCATYLHDCVIKYALPCRNQWAIEDTLH